MKEALEQLFAGKRLSVEQAEDVLGTIADGKANPSHLAALLTVFRMCRVSADELDGFQRAMDSRAIKVDLSDFETVDVCGTGGDGKNTFNISTLTAFIVAGTGVKVAKHGNVSASSVSGSSNVLEGLGVKFSNEADQLKRQLETAGMTYFHAPLFHPAMKNIAPVRKELGFRTIFNFLGPVLNPSSPGAQLLGVCDRQIVPVYQELLKRRKVKFSIVHALDGYDEISLTADAEVTTSSSAFRVTAAEFGFDPVSPVDIAGGSTVDESVKSADNFLKGEGTAEQEKVVFANAAVALATVKEGVSYPDGVAQAEESLKSGRAYAVLEKLRELSE